MGVDGETKEKREGGEGEKRPMIQEQVEPSMGERRKRGQQIEKIGGRGSELGVVPKKSRVKTALSQTLQPIGRSWGLGKGTCPNTREGVVIMGSKAAGARDGRKRGQRRKGRGVRRGKIKTASPTQRGKNALGGWEHRRKLVDKRNQERGNGGWRCKKGESTNKKKKKKK